MGLAPGQRLGPYEIVAPIGAGGMGEVYRARDPRLSRDVAVKVLPEHFAETSTPSSHTTSPTRVCRSSSPGSISPIRAGTRCCRPRTR